MKYSNPFYFVGRAQNSTINVLDEYIFSNNRGLALLCLTLMAVLLLLWDLGVKRLYHKIRPKINAQSITIPPILEKTLSFINRYMSWFVIGIVSILCSVYLIMDTKDWYNLVSLRKKIHSF